MKYVLFSQREQTDRYGVQIDVLESTYTKYFEELGFVPIAVTNFCDDVSPYFRVPELAGVVLTGGGSVPAEYYNDVRSIEGQGARGKVEKGLLRMAMDKRLPVLGICHGMQFINGFCGGRVSKLSFPESERKNGIDHPVVWDGRKVYVNNYHDDGIYRHDLAKDLLSIAEDIDYGVVEAFISADRMMLGVQWHPERQFSDDSSREKTKELILSFLRGRE